MNVFAFLVSMAMFVGGIVLMGYAGTFVGYELIAFLGGILLASAGVAFPVHVLKRTNP